MSSIDRKIDRLIEKGYTENQIVRVLREGGEGFPNTVNEEVYTVDLPIDTDELKKLLNDAESIAVERVTARPGGRLERIYLTRKSDGRYPIVATISLHNTGY